MPSAAELRAELKALRKESAEHKPVSRMKKGDISAQIERLKKGREETPAPAAVPSAAPRRMHPKADSVKESKAEEFATKPAAKPAARAKPAAAAKRTSKAELRRMLEELTSDEE